MIMQPKQKSKCNLFKITVEEAAPVSGFYTVTLGNFQTIIRLTCGKNSSQRLRLPLFIDRGNGHSVLRERRQALQREGSNRIDFNLQNKEVVRATSDILQTQETEGI